MTAGTIGRQACSQVVGIQRGVVIRLVAGNAFRRGIAVRSGRMATGAILDLMPSRQREEIVINGFGFPAKFIDVVALGTVG